MQHSTWNIKLVDFSAGYGQSLILDSISASFFGGKINVVLGGSGGGKSTLLKHVIGLMKPLAGQVLINEQDLFELPKKEFKRLRRSMGVLFQDGALLGSISVGDNVALPLTEHTKLPANVIKEIVLHKLSLVGLDGTYDYFPSELSGGMRKRAGLARALAIDPPILVCDEPTSGLDPISAAQMDMLLLSMKKMFPFMTMVVVTHDMESVKNIADNIIVLNNKKIIFSGTYEELLSTDDLYLRQFIDRKAFKQKVDEYGTPLNNNIRQQMHEALGRFEQNK